MRDAGYRFHMQGMPRKEKRDECAAPARPGYAEKEREQQHGGNGVQQDANQMLRSALCSEKGEIDEVRETGDREPVGGVVRCRGPKQIRESKGAAGVVSGSSKLTKSKPPVWAYKASVPPNRRR